MRRAGLDAGLAPSAVLRRLGQLADLISLVTLIEVIPPLGDQNPALAAIPGDPREVALVTEPVQALMDGTYGAPIRLKPKGFRHRRRFDLVGAQVASSPLDGRQDDDFRRLDQQPIGAAERGRAPSGLLQLIRRPGPRIVTFSLIEKVQHFFAGVYRRSKAFPALIFCFFRLVLTRRFAGGASSIPAKPLDRLPEAVGRHGQVDRLPIVLDLPAEYLHQFKVFTELPGKLVEVDALDDRAQADLGPR